MQVVNAQSVLISNSKRVVAVTLLALLTGNTWAADVDHNRAINLARNHVPSGVAVEVEDEIYDGIEDTYEVELIINNGNTIADVEIDRTTGAVVQYNEPRRQRSAGRKNPARSIQSGMGRLDCVLGDDDLI